MLKDDILSYVREERPYRLVYSLLASYGAERGGSLPGSWFVAALEPFGHRPTSVRQTLYRMEREGALTSTPLGPNKLYRLSPLGRAGTDAGTDRLRTAPTRGWDGRWTVVSYEFSQDQRQIRELVRGLLEVDGFANLTRATFVHPRDRTQRLSSALAAHDVAECVHVFRSERIGGASDMDLIGDLWDLEAISRGYESFLETFGAMAHRRRWDRIDPMLGVATRFAVVIRYLETAWQDPDIPTELLPAAWPAAKAQALAASLVQRLHAPLMEYGDHVLQTLPRPVSLVSGA